MSMDESKIVASKAEPVEVKSPESFKDKRPEGFTTQVVNPLFDYFDIPMDDARLTETFDKIWDWATSQSKNNDKESIMFEVIRLKNRLGEPSIGEKPWAKIMNYISIDNRVKEDEKMLEEMKNG